MVFQKAHILIINIYLQKHGKILGKSYGTERSESSIDLYEAIWSSVL